MMDGRRARIQAYRATSHYIWKANDVIGSGAFGTVFKGYNKRSGEVVAVKALSERVLSAAHVDQHLKEVTLLGSLNHPNIVQLVGVESELAGEGGAEADNRGKVIVMEFCSHGSLYSLIEQPANGLGLPDAVLLHILQDLVSGLRYLRQNHKLVHRDVKPSNILKTVTQEGRIVYKLCDFGAAKVLEDEEPFKSFVGTEEYLHPDIYRRIYGNGPDAKSAFDPSCDLWSIGVTLYQLATGHLPFQPIGGQRTNRRAMLEMTLAKPQGTISGLQMFGPDGKVFTDWGRELPEHSAMTCGLRRELRPLLASLLELSEGGRLSYEAFFSAAEALGEKRPLHLLDVPKALFRTSYRKGDLASAVQEAVGESGSLLLWGGRLLSGSKRTEELATTAENPIIVLPRRALAVAEASAEQLGRQQKHMREIPMPPAFSPEEDFLWARSVCAAGHMAQKRLDSLKAALDLLGHARRQLRQSNKDRVECLERCLGGWRLAWAGVQSSWDTPAGASPDTLQRKKETAAMISKSSLDVETQVMKARATLTAEGGPAPPCPVDLSHGHVMIGDALAQGSELLEMFQKDQVLFKRVRAADSAAAKDDRNWHCLMKQHMRSQMRQIAAALGGAPFQDFRLALTNIGNDIQAGVLFAEQLGRLEADVCDLGELVSAHQAALAKMSETGNLGVALGVPPRKLSPSDCATNQLIADGMIELTRAAQEIRQHSLQNSKIMQSLIQMQ